MGNRAVCLRFIPPRQVQKKASNDGHAGKSAQSNRKDYAGDKRKKSVEGSRKSEPSRPHDADEEGDDAEGFQFTGFKKTEKMDWNDKVLASLLGGAPTNLETAYAIEGSDGLLERGPVVLADGSVYLGQWKGLERWGQGKQFEMNGSRYVGAFANDKYDGPGEISYMNGDNFKGIFRNGMKNGKGVMVYKNGNMFDGNYKNDLREGFGVERFADGSVYMGSFKNNKREGRGEMRMNNGVLYEGTFDNDITGFGKMSWPNGESYEGEFKNGYKHRFGVTSYKSGEVLSEKGTYNMGRMHGFFECTMRNGYVMKCIYDNGKFIQDVTNSKDADKYKCPSFPDALNEA